jgi:hypothetical protein
MIISAIKPARQITRANYVKRRHPSKTYLGDVEKNMLILSLCDRRIYSMRCIISSIRPVRRIKKADFPRAAALLLDLFRAHHVTRDGARAIKRLARVRGRFSRFRPS